MARSDEKKAATNIVATVYHLDNIYEIQRIDSQFVSYESLFTIVDHL